MKATGLLLIILTALLTMTWPAGCNSQITPQQARRQVRDAVNFFMHLTAVQIDAYWHVGDYENCIRLLKLQIELKPRHVEAYDGAAWLLWSMRRFDEAEALYKQGIAKNPKTYRLYFELGQMYYLTARPSLYNKSGEESRRLYEKAVEQLYLAVQHPCPAQVNRLLARILHTLHRYDEERKVLEDILKDNPTDTIARRNLKRLEEMGK
ncbi:MAG: tetratricopeptide repeat protein [Armatimonadetes bacterium]|nr:tetratricopeptide repeat protein [Armatimonadota bacterium]NIO76819.1 tetratricopeptide repeat protein [Armatimonadota bacterium]NIO97189.1 tetratricopeptide repeat protein [Armatimonadota bacterium]